MYNLGQNTMRDNKQSIPIEIRKQTIQDLDDYGNVSIAFTIERRFRIKWLNNGLDGIQLIEELIDPPLVKDFEENEAEGPIRWSKRWEISHWGIFAAFVGNTRVGGAVIAYDTPGVHMLEGHDDLACLWDIRVDEVWRNKGIGTALFHHALSWVRQTKCTRLKIETQNNNVHACRFYAKQGCRLGGILPHSTPEDPDEYDLFRYLELKD
jgi:GNAT superfamily N-acetyltransferase